MHTSPIKRPQAQPATKQPGADWLSWSLHLLFGLVIGAMAGTFVAMQMIRLRLIGGTEMHYIIAGIALFGSAITSYRGNRAWIAPSVFAPEEPPQSRNSQLSSLVIGAAGLGIVAFAIYRHLQGATWQHKSHSLSPDFLVFFLLLEALLVWLLVHALRTGTALGRYGIIYRHEAPTGFWLYVVMMASSIIYLLVDVFL